MQHWSKKFLKYKKERAYFYNFCFFFYIIFKNKKFLPFKYPFKNDNSKIEPKFIAKLSKKYIVPIYLCPLCPVWLLPLAQVWCSEHAQWPALGTLHLSLGSRVPDQGVRGCPWPTGRETSRAACCQDVCAQPTGPTGGTAGADASSWLRTHTLFSAAVLKAQPEGLCASLGL